MELVGKLVDRKSKETGCPLNLLKMIKCNSNKISRGLKCVIYIYIDTHIFHQNYFVYSVYSSNATSEVMFQLSLKGYT